MAGTTLKGINIEIGGDTKGLTTALNGVNDAVKTTEADLKKVEKLLKLDPTNTELLSQKQKLLKQAVSETKDKLDTMREAEKQLQEQVKKGEASQAQYDALRREIIAAENSLKSLETQAKKSNVALEYVGAVANKVADGAKKVADGAKKVADSTKVLSAAAGGALTALGGAAYSAATMADDLNTLSKQSGFTTAELQKMQYAADRIDVSMDDITSSAQKLKKNMASSSESVQQAFSAIGVSATNADGDMRNSTAVYWDVIHALSRVANETERDQIAMTLLGKSADSLAGIIDDGGVAFRKLGVEAEQAGLIMDQDTLDSLNAVNDQIDKVKATAKATLTETGAKALEAVMPVVEQIIDAIGSVLEWVSNLDEGQIQMIATVLAVVAAISPIAGLVGAISTAISGLSVALAFLAANPIVLLIGLIVGALVALGAICYLCRDQIKDAFSAVADFLKGVFDSAVGVIKNAINGVISIVNGAIGGINSLIEKANSVTGFFGFTMGTLPTIPMLANGGTLLSGSAIVGEAGPELLTVGGGKAVVQPLTGAESVRNSDTASQNIYNHTTVEFRGSLAQLAAVLQPYVVTETTRLGSSMVR